ncbi:hypothetical protein [Alteromonas gracilis]|uniref:hypothetical protein n=1 Tax=Alteromonas gracilis TaxID=1479524 RepID=UPI002FE3A247
MAKLSIVVHTEEEFDWDGGFYRRNNKVTHDKELTEFCEKLIQAGGKVVFAMDYAFVSSEQGKAVVKHFQKYHAEDVEFATHLHPWVNPPFEDIEPVPEKHSYPGNLPYSLEFEKLKCLTEVIEKTVGRRPTTYLAGRYGVGENSYEILSKLGYTHDVSISAFADFTHQEGPNFSEYTNHTVVKEGITCIPHSTGYISYLSAFSNFLNKAPKNLTLLNNNVLGKVVLRLMGVKKVRLSPEGFTAKEMQKLTDSLLATGTQHLIFSFHSSSVKIGGSPYTNSPGKLEGFRKHSFNLIENRTASLKQTLIAKPSL